VVEWRGCKGVHWTDGEDRRKKVLQLFEDSYALDDDAGGEFSEGDPEIDVYSMIFGISLGGLKFRFGH
jgi:hypothetical protein